MNPDANPTTPKDDNQAAVTGASPQDAVSPETPAVSSEPAADISTAPVAPEGPASPPVGPTNTPAAPVVETPGVDQHQQQQVPAVAPLPSVGGTAPSTSKKLIIVAGLAVLVLVVVAALLTLL